MFASRSVRRFAALALPVIVIGSFWTLLIEPLVEQIGNDRESIASSRRLLAAYHVMSAEVPTLKRRLDQLRTAGRTEFFLKRTSPALMTALMQETVQRLAASEGVDILSSRTLPEADTNGLDGIGVELEFAASVAVFGAFLHAIASARPAILVERLVVQAPESGIASSAAKGQPRFRTTLRLSSYASQTDGGSP